MFGCYLCVMMFKFWIPALSQFQYSLNCFLVSNFVSLKFTKNTYTVFSLTILNFCKSNFNLIIRQIKTVIMERLLTIRYKIDLLLFLVLKRDTTCPWQTPNSEKKLLRTRCLNSHSLSVL